MAKILVLVEVDFPDRFTLNNGTEEYSDPDKQRKLAKEIINVALEAYDENGYWFEDDPKDANGEEFFFPFMVKGSKISK